MLYRCLVPDQMFDRYQEITPAYLTSLGIRALLVDIDNTLAPYEQADADDTHRAWVADMAAHGIAVALISNNNRARVERFNQTLGLPAYWKSGKPRRRCLDLAMKQLGVTPKETAILGDQLLTDAYAGKHIGLTTLIVPPLKDKRTLFFRFKRLLERPFLRRYRKLHQKDRCSAPPAADPSA